MSVRRLHPEQPESFAFTDENAAYLQKVIARYPEGRQASAVIPALMVAQSQEGWISRPAIETVAKLLDMPDIRVLGRPDTTNRIGVVSIQTKKLDNAQAAFRLEQEYGILTRVGLHCAPNAHKTLGSYPEGSIRFSFGHQTTSADIDTALDALRRICQ